MIEAKNFLGYGGFANVYLVTRKSDGAQVAIKQSQRPMIEMDDEQKSFTREVNAMKNLDHPFVIKLYEAFKQNDHYFLATQYADGGSLDKLLETKIGKKLSVDEAVDFFSMICVGLNYIHS